MTVGQNILIFEYLIININIISVEQEQILKDLQESIKRDAENLREKEQELQGLKPKKDKIDRELRNRDTEVMKLKEELERIDVKISQLKKGIEEIQNRLNQHQSQITNI